MREVIDVPEARRQDKSLDMLLTLRKQRVDRFEQELRVARAAWRDQRAVLRDVKERRRKALQEAKGYWQEARTGFLSMATTSGEYRRAKAVYERMKETAAQLYLECLEEVGQCKSSRAAVFEAHKRLMDGQRQHEKLGMLCDEIRILNHQSET
ncbi:MAG: hypothetical protein V7642_5802 [Burkholderiales bacterium]|jgi:hypothetical protein